MELWFLPRVELRTSRVTRGCLTIFFDRFSFGNVSALLTVTDFLTFLGEAIEAPLTSTRSALVVVWERKVLAVSTNRYRLEPLCSYFLGVLTFTGERKEAFLTGLLLCAVLDDFLADDEEGELFFIPFGAKALFLGTTFCF